MVVKKHIHKQVKARSRSGSVLLVGFTTGKVKRCQEAGGREIKKRFGSGQDTVKNTSVRFMHPFEVTWIKKGSQVHV